MCKTANEDVERVLDGEMAIGPPDPRGHPNGGHSRSIKMTRGEPRKQIMLAGGVLYIYSIPAIT